MSEQPEPATEHRSNAELRRENQRLRDLLSRYADLVAWVAPRIERRNMNGMPSDRFCLLCSLGQPQYKRLPCRHEEIWRLGAKEKVDG